MSGSKKNQSNETEGVLIVAENRQARRDYEILETFEAGMALLGHEVKSLRAGEVNLRDSYIRPKNGELFLVGCSLKPYRFTRPEEVNATRDRKLLLHKKEISKLDLQVVKKGLSLIPLKVYFKGGRAKLQFAVGRGKKNYDRRQDVKKREVERELARVMKR